MQYMVMKMLCTEKLSSARLVQGTVDDAFTPLQQNIYQHFDRFAHIFQLMSKLKALIGVLLVTYCAFY